jgi:hypothetical protein
MPQVIGGIALVPPRRTRDCACAFCGLFRAHHYWWRALGASVTAAGLVALPVVVDHAMRTDHARPNEVAAVIGMLMLIATGAVVLAIGSWTRPVRRLVHMLRPRADPPWL